MFKFSAAICSHSKKCRMRNSNSRSRFANSEPVAKTSPQNSEKKHSTAYTYKAD